MGPGAAGRPSRPGNSTAKNRDPLWVFRTRSRPSCREAYVQSLRHPSCRLPKSPPLGRSLQPFAANCLAVLLLAGSRLSFRASGFAFVACVLSKKWAAARGSKSNDLPAVRLRTWRLDTLSTGPVARKPTCRLCGIQAAAAQKLACNPCNRKLQAAKKAPSWPVPANCINVLQNLVSGIVGSAWPLFSSAEHVSLRNCLARL